MQGLSVTSLKQSVATVADTGFEKGGGVPTPNFQINGFWPEFYIKKVKFVKKRFIEKDKRLISARILIFSFLLQFLGPRRCIYHLYSEAAFDRFTFHST